jgi:hypothetical protein
VVANYYLSDGIIHELIDWCEHFLKELPLFTCIGHPLPSDVVFFQKHSIVDVFDKKNPQKVARGLSELLFNFNEFHESLLELVTPKEISILLLVGGHKLNLWTHEIYDNGLYFQTERSFMGGTFGILKFSLVGDDKIQNFVIPGHVEGQSIDGTLFRINHKYAPKWKQFLTFLNEKQIKVNRFLKRASGL